MKKMKFKIWLLAVVMLLGAGSVWGQTHYSMSSGNYSETFADIANWTNSYAAGTGANNWRVATNVATSTVNTFAVFVTGTTGGIQKGTLNLILLATGTNSSATDLLLNFSNRNAGTISLDYEKVVNTANASPRSSDLKIQYSIDNGATFTDLTGYTIPRVLNNSSAESGTLSQISLPSALNNQSQVVIRFYVWNNGQTGGSGNRPKISIDNVAVTSTAISSCTSLATPTVTPTAGNTQATLSWGAVANATSYTLIWNGGSPETVTSPVTKTGLSNGTSYSYSVMAVGDGTTYCATNIAATGNVTPVAPPAPVAPTATAATSVTSSGFTANWEAVSGATGYRLDVYSQSAGSNASDLFISEYIEGSSNNKAIEIYNGTGSSVDLSDYELHQYNNGSATVSSTLALTGTLANNDVFVIANSLSTIFSGVDLSTNSAVMGFNGDDAIVLYKKSTTSNVDIFGRIGNDPGTAWTGDGGYTTVDKTLVRKSSVSGGITTSPTGTGVSAFTTLTTEWDLYNVDVVTYLGSHTFSGGSSQTYVSGFENHDAGDVTTKAVTGLNGSTEYFYVVRAYNGSGTSANSNTISATTTAGSTPTLTVSTTTLSDFTYALGTGPSAVQSFTISGTNLTNDISIAATTNYEISKTSGSGYTTLLTFAHSGGTVTEQTVYVRLKSGLTQGTYNSEVINITSTGASAKTVTVSGSVTAAPTAEPSNHATAFVANTNSTTQITVTWTDANGGADSYIIKGSSVNAESITAPVDGTAEADAALVKNIAAGVGSATFTGLTASTTYYFKVYPYNGTGTGVNYKTDGSVPTVNTTTLSILEIPTATASSAITATGFTANWDAVNSATGYYLDVYTKTAGSGEVTVSQGFDNGTTAPNWTFSSISGTYTTNTNYGTTSPSLKLDATDASVLTPILPSSATELSFWIKGQSASGGSTLLVEGYNGSSWVTIQSIENPAGTGTTYLYTSSSTPALPSNLTQFRFTYTKVTGNIAFDDVIYKYGSSAENTSISGSPFTVNSSNSKVITGLTPGTEYFYAVRAKRSSDSSVTDASNEISVITDFIFNSSVNASDLAEGTTRGVVIEDGGHLTIDENRTFASVTVETGGKLTLNNGFTFEPGTFTIEDGGTFVDKRSDATKTSINATVNVELTGSATAAARQWWYVSSPVAAATAAVFNPEGDNNIGYFDETLSTPNYVQILSNSDPLHVGKGYLFQNKATATYTFTGALNTGDVTLNLTRTGNSAGQRGFHIVGNPYPSYLNWKNAFDAGTTSNVRNTIWYRTTTGSANGMKFLTFNAATQVGTEGVSGVVPPMQGFWMKVHADNSNGVIKFTNDMRSHATSPGNSRKAPAVDNKQLLRLQVSNSLVTDEMVLVGIEGASDAFEKYDSEKMANNSPDIPELYTLIGSQEIAINSVEALTIGKQFILGFRPGQAGSFSIKATELTNLENVKVILKDNQLNTETELLANESYTFTSDATATTNRFSIEFRAPGATTSLHEVTAKNTLVYVNDANQIEVQSVALSTADRISVFNLAGQQLVSQAASGQVTVINEPFSAGVYLVKVNSHLQKVIVK